MGDTKYIKLSDLVGSEFTVEKVYFPQYKMWDNEARRMLVSERWEKGYRKIYGIVSDKGTLDMSANQYANMLEAVSKAGEANVIHRTFTVKSNGQTGMDIRYYINAKAEEKQPAEAPAWEAVREKFNKPEQVDNGGLTEEEISQIPF